MKFSRKRKPSRHELMQQELVSVDFLVGKDGSNLLDNKISGKKKKGAVFLQPCSPLCNITCKNGKQSCIRGSLIELNENLV